MAVVLLGSFTACVQPDTDEKAEDGQTDSFNEKIEGDQSDTVSGKKWRMTRASTTMPSPVEGDSPWEISYEFEYDENGLTQLLAYVDGTLELGATFDGSIERILTDGSYEGDGTFQLNSSFAYDDSGKLIESTQLASVSGTRDENGDFVEKYNWEISRYTYDEERLTEVIVYADGEESERISCEYDEDGRLVCKRTTSGYGDTYYKYNEAGDLIEVSEGEASKETYQYDDSGALITKVSYYDGEEMRRIDYEYDEYGNPILLTLTSGGETESVFIEYELVEDPQYEVGDIARYLEFIEH